jgi:hypothetical protein
MRYLRLVALTERGLKFSQFLVEMNSKLAVVLKSGDEFGVVDQALAVGEALLNQVTVQQTLWVNDGVEDGSGKLWELGLVESTRDEDAKSVSSLEHQTVELPHVSGLEDLDTVQSLEQGSRLSRLRGQTQLVQASVQLSGLVLVRGVPEGLQRRRGDRRVALGEGREILVLIFVRL